MKIKINDTYSQIDIDGVIKTVKLDSVIKAFSSTKTAIDSPILPKNCIRYKENGNGCTVLVYHEPTKFTATLADDTIVENCVRPGLVVRYQLNKLANDNFTLSGSHVFGIKVPYIAVNDNTKLYGLSFPNVSSNGWICWGGMNNSGTFNSLVSLSDYIERFFVGSKFNNHLFSSPGLRILGINGYKEFFQYISNCGDIFPNELYDDIGNYTFSRL